MNRQINFKKINFFNILPIQFSSIKPKIFLQNYSTIRFFPVYKILPKVYIRPQLNIFTQIKISEPDHSVILANLLDPRGTHGHNSLFLEKFFGIFVPEMDIGENEYWTVTAEKEHYDIRIKNQDNSKIIIIENKSNNAQDQQNQLYRYWFHGIYTPQLNRALNGLECFARIIYLSPADYKQPEEQSFSRPDYMDKNLPEKVPRELITTEFFNDKIVKWLELCIKAVYNDMNVYHYLNQYKDFWR